MLLTANRTQDYDFFSEPHPEKVFFDLIFDFFTMDVAPAQASIGSYFVGTVMFGGGRKEYHTLINKMTQVFNNEIKFKYNNSRMSLGNRELHISHQSKWCKDNFKGLQGNFCIIYGYENISVDMLKYLNYRSRFWYLDSNVETQAAKFHIVI